MGAKILTFIKRNLISLIAVVIALIGVPVMVFFSNKMVAEVVDQAQSDVNSLKRELDTASTATYSIPASAPGGQPWQLQTEPNSAIRERVREIRERQKQESSAIGAAIFEHNKKESRTFFLGAEDLRRLLPRPRNTSEKVELLDRLLADRPVTYANLLERFGLGGPPDAERLVRDLNRTFNQQSRNYEQLSPDGVMSDEQAADLEAELSRVRVSRYRDHAAGLTFYAEMDAFPDASPWAEGDQPELDVVWWWQFYLWAHEEMLGALVEANTSSGVRQSVVTGPIKRLLQMDVLGPDQADVSSPDPRQSGFGRGGVDMGRGGGQRGFGPQPAGGGSRAGAVPENLMSALPRNFALSPTGRAGWPTNTNGYYDVFMVELELIVEANRLNEVIGAINATNLMTVVEVSEFEQISLTQDLQEGYYYGPSQSGEGFTAELEPNPVARVELKVETVWLRRWLKALMPSEVREQLQIPRDG